MSQLKLTSLIAISYKKISKQIKKSLLIIIPVSLLTALIIFSTSEKMSIIQAVESSVITALENQSKVIELTKQSQGPGGNFLRQFGASTSSGTTDYYTSDDQSAIQKFEGVEDTTLVSSLPIRPVSITEISGVKDITINNLSSLDAANASVYTTSNFDYSEGDSIIPIILSANDLQEKYSDWQGKESITVNLGNPSGNRSQNISSGTNPRDEIRNSSPTKTRTIQYNPQTLIGSTITIEVGGLEDIMNYSENFANGSITFTKLSETELQNKENERKAAIAKYWDYNTVSKPLTYTFKVVGITEGSDKTRTYIPTDFAQKLVKDYLHISVSARNSTPIAEDDQSIFTGLTYDSNYLSYNQFSVIGRQFQRQNDALNTIPTQGRGTAGTQNRTFSAQQTRYFIPGLVYHEDVSSNKNLGEYIFAADTTSYPFETKTLLVSLTSSDHREQVINKLNESGYAVQNTDKLSAVNQLKNTLQKIVNWVIVGIAILVGTLVLFTLTRFVTDSRREIGIYRALGATSGAIRNLMIIQTLLLTGAGYVVGSVLGFTSIFALANLMVNSLQSIITQTIGNSLVINKVFQASDFYFIDWKQILTLIIILTVFILLISLIPAQNAAKTSPIKAIRES